MPASQSPAPQPQDPPGSFLFSDDVIRELTDEEERHGLYTAERCPKDKRDAIITLTAQGLIPDFIRRIVHVDRRTVLAVADHFKVEIADYVARMPPKLQRIKWRMAERLERELDSIPVREIPGAMRQIIESELMASGQATARVEHVHRVDIFADFHAFVQSLEPGDVIPEKQAAEMGELGGKFLLPAPGADDHPDHPGPSGFDSVSDGNPPFSQEDSQNIPTFIPQPSQAPDTAGGGREPSSAAGPATDNPPEKILSNGSVT